MEDGTKNNSGSIPLDSAWFSWAIPSFCNSCYSFVEDGYWVSWACKSPCWHLLRWCIWPGFSIQASVLSFTSGSQAFLALIFTSYFCIPLGIMRNTELLSCSNLRSRETCFEFAQSPRLGTPTMVWAAGNAMGTPLCPLGHFFSAVDLLSWLLLLLKPTGLSPGSGGRVGWIWEATMDCNHSCILSSKNIEKGKQIEKIIHSYIYSNNYFLNYVRRKAGIWECDLGLGQQWTYYCHRQFYVSLWLLSQTPESRCCCEGILQMWSTSVISALYVKEIILDNVCGSELISWKSLRAK